MAASEGRESVKNTMPLMPPDSRSARLSHLWSLASQCAEENPELSRFYMNEIISTEDNGTTDVSAEFCLKYCQHCYILFTGENCRVRVQPKRRKKKNKNRKEDNKYLNKKQVLKLPRKLNHVGVFCKMCGKQSFYPGRERDPQIRTKPSSATPEQNLTAIQETTPVSSKSAKERRRRRSRNSKLKYILQANERQKSMSAGSMPQLQDFLSSLN